MLIAEDILKRLEAVPGFQGKSRIGEKRPKRASKEMGGSPSPSKPLFGLFSLILHVFPLEKGVTDFAL